MARALLFHERQSDSSWKTVAAAVCTEKRIDMKVLPGSARRDAFLRGIVPKQPPFKDGLGLSLERGTFEDWATYALASLSNGHDTWVTEVEPVMATGRLSVVAATYGQYVLGSVDQPAPSARPTDDVPELSGYRKVRPK